MAKKIRLKPSIWHLNLKEVTAAKLKVEETKAKYLAFKLKLIF